jgi:hypothetical protein
MTLMAREVIPWLRRELAAEQAPLQTGSPAASAAS